MARRIRKAGITGIFSRRHRVHAAVEPLRHEELLDGVYMTPTYGNTLMGLAAEHAERPHNDYKITYYAPQPRAVIEVVDFDDHDQVVDYGETGRVKLTTLTKEFFVPGLPGARRRRARAAVRQYPWDGVSGVRPFREFAADDRGRSVLMTVREMLKLLRQDGWVIVRQTGSHRQFYHATKKGTVTLAGKPSMTLHPKIVASVLKQAQIEEP